MAVNRSQQHLVITDRRDAHIDFVQRHLPAPFLVADPVEIAEGKATLSYRAFRGRFSILLNGEPMDSVTHVWYRKPETRHLLQDVQLGIYADYSDSAVSNHVAMLCSHFPEVVWISDFYAIRRASQKSFQLQLAKAAGFRVPETLITSDSEAARAFLAKRKRLIVKPNTTELPAHGKTRYAFFTTEISHSNPPDLARLHLAPSIFQQLIEAESDIRVTVVGDKVFAAEIKNIPQRGKVRDWRLNHRPSGNLFKSIDLDKHTAFLSRELVRKLGLRFGAIDLVKDKHGNIWFLEINPNGQWAFVEEDTGLPIGKAMAELMMSVG